MNKVVLCGRLCKDPEVRYTQDQKPIARITLACDRRGKDKGADFIPCVAFSNQAEMLEKYFKKGMKADVSGRIQTGSYKDKEGRTVYTTEVVLDDVEFGESKAASAAQEKPAEKPEEFMQVDDDADLPFN